MGIALIVLVAIFVIGVSGFRVAQQYERALGEMNQKLPVSKLGDHNYFGFFTTDDIDGLHRGFAAKGAIIRSGPADKPWGWREMAVATPEGHRMMFAQRL